MQGTTTSALALRRVVPRALPCALCAWLAGIVCSPRGSAEHPREQQRVVAVGVIACPLPDDHEAETLVERSRRRIRRGQLEPDFAGARLPLRPDRMTDQAPGHTGPAMRRVHPDEVDLEQLGDAARQHESDRGRIRPVRADDGQGAPEAARLERRLERAAAPR